MIPDPAERPPSEASTASERAVDARGCGSSSRRASKRREVRGAAADGEGLLRRLGGYGWGGRKPEKTEKVAGAGGSSSGGRCWRFFDWACEVDGVYLLTRRC